MPALQPDQLAFFHQEGFLVAPGVIPRAVIEAVQEEISEVVDQTARRLHAEGKIQDLCLRHGFLTRLGELYRQCPAILGPVSGGTHAGPALFRLLTCPELLDVVQQLLGPEIIASSVYRLRPKLAFHEAGEVPWHQDSGYFHTMGDQHLILTCWVPLMNASMDTGAMEVIPRAHLNGVRRHFSAAIKAPSLTVHPDHLPDTPPVPVPAMIGDVVMMSNLCPHHSVRNTSGLVRWATDLRYNAPSAGNYYPYEAEFIARSPTQPEKVLTDWREFVRLRKEHKSVGGVDRSWLKQDQETFVKPIRL